MAERNGPETTVPDWRARLACSDAAAGLDAPESVALRRQIIGQTTVALLYVLQRSSQVLVMAAGQASSRRASWLISWSPGSSGVWRDRTIYWPALQRYGCMALSHGNIGSREVPLRGEGSRHVA
jgi:hypothetical protein